MINHSTLSTLALLPQKRSDSPISLTLTAKSFSFLESILTIVKRIFATITSSQKSNGEPLKSLPTLKISLEEESDLGKIPDLPGPNEFHISKKPQITVPILEEDTPFLEEEPPLTELEKLDSKPIEAPVPEEVSQKLALTTSDKLLTASHFFQWGLIGATTFCGLAPAIAGTLGTIASIGSEIANYCMLPEDASLFRKVMTFPIISKAVLGFNPIIKGLSQTYSTLSFAQTSAHKLSDAWEGLKSDPVNAVKAGAVNLFNLASNVAFSAESVGLVNLRPKISQDKSPEPPQKQSTSCRPVASLNLPCDGCGMFSVEHYLIGVFDQFEKGKYSGVNVDFKEKGLYYDPSHGPNWFQYYFQSVDTVDKNCMDAPKKSFTQEEYGDLCNYVENVYGYENSGLSPERAKGLIQKYLPLKPEIQKEVDQFAKTHFSESDYVIGVHYRGTDKACNSHHCEARRVTYEEMTSRINDHIREIQLEDPSKMKIFAASDEEGFIDHVKEKFPGQVVASPATRSTNGKPLHFNAKNPYQVGKEALIDSQLLAKISNVLIRTSSNLSKFASLLLREGAKVIEVSKRYYQDPVST